MKIKTITLSLAITLTSGCAAMFSSDSRLIETASFDFSIPKEEIKIIQSNEEMDQGRYLLEVGGKTVKYKRMGSVYYQADKPPVPGI